MSPPPLTLALLSEIVQSITLEEYRRLLDASPCQDWRVIIALARYGGLRAPSEVLRLRWSDINWEKSRFYVSSSKTERYEGKESRVVPLFEELREELEKLFFAQPEKTEFVITRYRDPERSNLGTQFARIVKMAGVEPIQRPFDNMRASRSAAMSAISPPLSMRFKMQILFHREKHHHLFPVEDPVNLRVNQCQ